MRLTHNGMIISHFHCGSTLSVDKRVCPPVNRDFLPGVIASWRRGQRGLSKSSKNRRRHVGRKIVTAGMEVNGVFSSCQDRYRRNSHDHGHADAACSTGGAGDQKRAEHSTQYYLDPETIAVGLLSFWCHAKARLARVAPTENPTPLYGNSRAVFGAIRKPDYALSITWPQGLRREKARLWYSLVIHCAPLIMTLLNRKEDEPTPNIPEWQRHGLRKS